MLVDRIQDRTAVIGVIGLGYVGLPLAIAFAREGYSVEGFDTDTGKVTDLHRGYTLIGIDPTELMMLLDMRRLNFQFKLPNTWEVDVVIICVPTPITEDKKPDLSCIRNAVESLSFHLKPDREVLIILESSTYPGTTREILASALNWKGCHIAYSPERIDPGNKKFNIRNTPKLVGGIDKESTELATLLYEQIVDKVISVSSPEVAEMAKLFENVFRNVNIALVNEMALICERIGVSVWEMIDAAATKPFGFMPFYPGVGVGGHCIPVDPYYVIDKVKDYAPLIRTALSINEKMPSHVAYRIRKEVGVKGTKILVLGVAFKRDVSDVRESPSVELLEILQSWGANACYNDPYVYRITNHKTLDAESADLTDELLGSVDCVVIATDHSCYDWKWIVDKAKLVFDTRNATKGRVSDKIYRLGEKNAE